ncbi:hypothetical protein KCP71_25725 [Salmonella enterica subsp. enterica]|nr:hypothetical protein KCP71_25725 [Salmonella enterica subsp. enterica]
MNCLARNVIALLPSLLFTMYFSTSRILYLLERYLFSSFVPAVFLPLLPVRCSTG